MGKHNRGGGDHGGGSGGGGGQKKLNYKQKSSINYIQPSDPPFLRAMKAKMGYQEPTIEDKVRF